MLAACCHYALVFHSFLPSVGIVAQQGVTIAYQYRTGYELTRVAGGFFAEELTPNGLCAYVCFTAKGQHLLCEPQLGGSGENVIIAQIDVVAAWIAYDAGVVGHQFQRELWLAQGLERLVGSLPALVFLPALKGGDGTVLCQPYHVVQGQWCLPPRPEAERRQACQ